MEEMCIRDRAGSRGVFTIRRSEDIYDIKKACKAGSKAVIIGGGVIGLETAAELSRYGVHVTVLEAIDVYKRQLLPHLPATAILPDPPPAYCPSEDRRQPAPPRVQRRLS